MAFKQLANDYPHQFGELQRKGVRLYFDEKLMAGRVGSLKQKFR